MSRAGMLLQARRSPLVPIEVGPFKQRTRIGVRWCGGRNMRAMEFDVLVTEGLGDTSYVLTWVTRRRSSIRNATSNGSSTPRMPTEQSSASSSTHVHNDYVSGALELRAATGAEIWGPAETGYSF